MSDVKASDVLAKTREVLLERKWVSHCPQAKSETCLVHAVLNARSILETCAFEPFDFLYTVTGNDLDLDVWNDAPGRTFEEVIAAVDEATRLAKEAEAAA